MSAGHLIIQKKNEVCCACLSLLIHTSFVLQTTTYIEKQIASSVEDCCYFQKKRSFHDFLHSLV